MIIIIDKYQDDSVRGRAKKFFKNAKAHIELDRLKRDALIIRKAFKESAKAIKSNHQLNN